jgi:hypothetical protein
MDMSLVSGGYSAFNSVVSAYFGNQAESYKADAANQIREGNNAVLAKVNERNSAITALQRWRQGVANSRVYEAVKANQDALTANFNRARDQRARANFATNIRGAEESGRQQASAAASGITGSVVDVIDMTSRLRRGIETTATRQAEKQMTYDFDKQQLATRLATLDTLDYSVILDNQQIMDYGRNQAKTTNLFGAAISGKDTLKNLTQGLESVSGFFKTTQSTDTLGGLNQDAGVTPDYNLG